MKKTFVVFFVVFLGIFTNVAYSVCPSTTDVNACQEAGCALFLGTCSPCALNQYRDTTTTPYTCKACSNGPKDSNNKECGDDGAACQYTGNNGDSANCKWTMTCPNKSDFANGTWTPDSATITYNGTGTAPTCTYDLKKITCNTTGNSTCSNLGFHLDGESCVSNVQSCENNGYKFYTNNTWSDCYVSSCPDGQTLVQKRSCGTTSYGECLTNAIPCSTAPGLTTSACGGTISGNATLNGGTYNLSQCACEKTSTQISNGTAGEKCFYNGTSNKFDTGCTYTVNACNAGYCSTDSQTCVTVPANYFSAADDKTCHKCPAGATSPAGSTAKTACHYTSATTFTDSVGNFTLPASGNIEIKWNF